MEYSQIEKKHFGYCFQKRHFRVRNPRHPKIDPSNELQIQMFRDYKSKKQIKMVNDEEKTFLYFRIRE